MLLSQYDLPWDEYPNGKREIADLQWRQAAKTQRMVSEPRSRGVQKTSYTSRLPGSYSTPTRPAGKNARKRAARRALDRNIDKWDRAITNACA